MEVGYPEAVELDPIRDTLAEGGFAGAQVQTFGTSRDVLIRLPPSEDDDDPATLSNRVLNALQDGGPDDPDLRRVEFVGLPWARSCASRAGLR